MKELNNFIIAPPPITRIHTVGSINTATTFDTGIWRKDFEDYVEMLASIGIMKSRFCRKFFLYPASVSENHVEGSEYYYTYLDEILINKSTGINIDIRRVEMRKDPNDGSRRYDWTYDELNRLKAVTLYAGNKTNMEYSITPVVEYVKEE